ncbi:MAG: AEC family transporter [Desulfovibrionaceae bacterium]
MLDSLLLILPVFLILGLGVLLDVLEVLPRQTGSIIGGYVLYVALPILLVHILAGSSVEEVAHGGFWAGLLLTQALIYASTYGAEFFLARRGHGPAAAIALAASSCNVAFIGLPVIVSLMPGNHTALLAAGLAVITPNIVFIPCQIQMEYMKRSDQDARGQFARGQGARGQGGKGAGGAAGQLARSVLLNPFMVGMVVGFGLGLTGIGLWGPLDRAAEMIGGTTAPCMLLALGLDLREKVRVALSGNWRSALPRIGAVTVVKLVLTPLLAWGLLSLFGVTGTWLAVGVIQSGAATALVTYVIASIYGHVPEEVAMIAVVTNVLNLATLTVIAGILRAQGFF